MSQNQVIGKHKTTVCQVDGKTAVTYHQTAVVIFDNETITLNTGGYETVTTKLRMNQTSNQYDLGYDVYQKNRNWYVYYQGETIEFMGNKLVLTRD